MRKLCIIIPVFKRDWLSNHLLNFYYQFDNARTEYMIVVVGSEGRKSERLARGLTYIEVSNNLLDRKYDEGFLHCKQFNPDAVTLVGSDDFITQNYFEWALDHLDRGTHYVGLKDFFLTDIRSKQIYYWEGYPDDSPQGGNSIGAGRIYSRHLLEKINWMPFISDTKAFDHPNLQVFKTNGVAGPEGARTKSGYFHWHGDDERAENKVLAAIPEGQIFQHHQQPKKIIASMSDCDCRYWAVKSGEEINPASSFHSAYKDCLHDVTIRKQFSSFLLDTGFPDALMGECAVHGDGTTIWSGVDWVDAAEIERRFL